jgi:hypothetical protein
MAHGTPVISLKQDFNPTKLALVRVQQTYNDDTCKKLERPIIDGRSIEANLYSLREFCEAAEELNFGTGNKLFRYFCRILRNTIKDDWDTVVTDNGFDGVNGKTEIDFINCLQDWKLTFVTEDSRQESRAR